MLVSVEKSWAMLSAAQKAVSDFDKFVRLPPCLVAYDEFNHMLLHFTEVEDDGKETKSTEREKAISMAKKICNWVYDNVNINGHEDLTSDEWDDAENDFYKIFKAL